MRAQLSSAPARPGADNEDFAAAGPSAAVLLDGAGIPAGLESGCVHTVAWFSRTLGAALLARLADPASGSLASCLHDAIEQVRSLHGAGCDLSHPVGPTATVAAVRVGGDALEYLVLADSSVLLAGLDGSTRVITDRRVDEVLAGSRAALDAIPQGDPARPAAYRLHLAQVQSLRNASGGFWVAGADPAAAQQALTGEVPLGGAARLAGALLVSDGASRLTDLFGLASWAELAALAREHGTACLIRRIRAAEAADPQCRRWPRAKPSDDATAVYLDLDGSGG